MIAASLRASASIALAVLVPAGVAAAQVPPGPPISPSGDLFVPGDHVPLSGFALKTGGQATMVVEPEILVWIQAQPGSIEVARESGGNVTYHMATDVDDVNGYVTWQGAGTGNCVVVSDALLQDLTISTHWNAMLDCDSNNPPNCRGGQEEGASDGMGTLDYEPASGTIELDGGVHAEEGALSYNEDRAVFSDGTGVHAMATVPAFERYVAENYAIYAPTPLAAIALSDQVRDATGFPIAHRSHPRAFDPLSGPGEKVEPDLPVIQVVHAHIVKLPGDDPADGAESSVATFLLPPGWTDEVPEGTYPMLFNGFYDLHRSTFTDVGPPFMESLVEVYRHSPPRRAVGLLWNGGGATATTGWHASAYANANQLFQDAKALLKGDPDRMVFSGGSRGGTTALEMASNPDGHPYTARFVNARDPQTRIGTSVEHQVNPAYPLLVGSMAPITGYKDSWMAGWIDPVSSLPRDEAVLQNVVGTTFASLADSDHSIDSTKFRTALATEGTKVVLRYGTHDFSKSFSEMAIYANHLRADGIDVHLEVFFGFGHDAPTTTEPDNADLLQKVFDADYTITDSTEYFVPDPADITKPFDITPFASHVPLSFELPLVVGRFQDHTWSVVGEPDSRVRIRLRKLDGSWDPGEDPPVYSGPWIVAFNGTITSGGAEFAAGLVPMNLAGIETGYWWYEVDYSPDGDTTFETTLGAGDTVIPGFPSANQEPVFFVTANESMGLMVGSLTGGVTEAGRFVP